MSRRSLAGRFWLALWPFVGRHLIFEDGKATNFQEEIADPIWRFCSRGVDVWAVLGGLLPGVNILASHYQRHILGKTTLQDLPDHPEFVFNAAHLETGRNWIFCKKLMRTYKLGIIDQPDTKMSLVVAASSAFPPAFSPVVLRLDPNDFRRSEFAELFERVDLKRKVSLTDGGVYDNLGVHAIRDSDTLLVSDASNPLEANGGRSVLRALSHRSKRPIEIAVEQTKALRRHAIVTQLERREKQGALWTIGTRLGRYPLESPFAVKGEWRSKLEAIRTRLNSFSDQEKGWLINWGYLQCDLAIRSYYLPCADPPRILPFPQFCFSQPPQAQ